MIAYLERLAHLHKRKVIVLENHRKIILTALARGKWRTAANLRVENPGWKSRATNHHFRVLWAAGFVRPEDKEASNIVPYCLTDAGWAVVKEFGLQ